MTTEVLDRTIIIPLTRGLVATIDAEDFEKIDQFKWCAKKSGSRYYAVAYVKGGGRSNNKQIAMHRLILNYFGMLDIDHINGNQLDNRKCNLRTATRTQNNLNQLKVRKGTSKYKGVYFDKRNNRYIAEAKLNGKRIFQRSFLTEMEAAKAYDEVAIKHFGEFAATNFGEVKAYASNSFG